MSEEQEKNYEDDGHGMDRNDDDEVLVVSILITAPINYLSSRPVISIAILSPSHSFSHIFSS